MTIQNITELRAALENWNNDFLHLGRRIASFYFDDADNETIKIRFESATRTLRIKFLEIQVVSI
jgi:hypothetical protein